jgi:hypothetical protein
LEPVAGEPRLGQLPKLIGDVKPLPSPTSPLALLSKPKL